MLRGLLGGLISGTAVSGVCLAVASVIVGGGNTGTAAARNAEQQTEESAAAPQTAEVEVPAGSEFNQGLSDEAVSLPEPEPSAPKEPVGQADAPEPGSLAALSESDLGSANAPEIGQIDSSLETPEVPTEEGGVALGGDEPVVAIEQSRAPDAPQGDDTVSVSTEPAQPLTPEPVEEESGLQVVETETETSDQAPEAVVAEEAAVEDVPQTPTESEEAAPEVATGAETQQEPIAETSEATGPEPATATEDTGLAQITEEIEQAPTPEPAQPEVSDETAQADVGQEDDRVLDLAQAESATEEASSSVIGNIADGVTTDRLPRVGDPVETEEAALEPSEDETVPEAGAEDLRPIDRFAVEFENEGDKPLMAIVLMDDGNSLVGPEAFTDFPYPISFAVNVTSPNAKEIAQKYRDAGQEVLAMTNLPENAAAQDVEVAMGVYLEAVPEAVGIMEGLDTGLQSNREAAAQLAPILLASGHGLVMWPNGLNTAQKLAAREGVPSATVFRDFDGNGQGATVIRRFLDQAAFRAGQEEGGVIMVGRLRPDTISALLLWGLQDRASSVALAPVSAVLKASQQ
ncbi:divergent polysaccharide deacetylase family protein [Roseovarius rhodophyticola]|uniref:Divergent polysaccharide deacetylase family protein n=1 Tax=Roseovarius rhodophyticola TaxID=3080827 RepID=A0ABZ2TFX0_9RHOB|nr:divergent polysaccharide deacetylase family protein [Roseovarius sp. W115]MDV2928433.1 divergent polysaccharide deacetylase family protein [Roseovarius sp. W115]